ncbi:hypothetical protein NW759_017353 [Fusarium solani]|nr:hypothetical protein NW759_017353 [Fusarium solani]
MEYLKNHREADEAGNQAKSPTALRHPQAIEQEVLVKVEPSNSSGADEDLPADSEPTQHSSPTKKRKASSDPIDLTNHTPPPERDRLAKERQENARLAAE